MKTTKKSLLKLGEALLANPIANSNNAGKLLIHITKPEEDEVRSSTLIHCPCKCKAHQTISAEVKDAL